MVYRRDQPLASSTLRRSQPLLAANTNAADDSFGIDHYAFSNTTANNGFHQKVTNPIQPTAPATAASTVTLYSRQVHANVGPLQYSRGQNSAIPSPLTRLHGSNITLASLATTNLVNFTGVPISMGNVIAQGTRTGTGAQMFTQAFAWNGSTLTIAPSPGNIIRLDISGTTLQIVNPTADTYTAIYWSLEFYRCGT